MHKSTIEAIQNGKICNVCNEHLPADQFYRYKARNDLIYGRCKSCCKINNNNKRQAERYRTDASMRARVRGNSKKSIFN